MPCFCFKLRVQPGLLIKEMAPTDRPRERLAAKGADSLRSDELIAILLRTGLKGTSALAVAQELMRRFKTLDALAGATLDELCAVKGVGRDKAVTLAAAFALARRMAEQLRGESPLLDTPERIVCLLREDLRHRTVETFHVVLLNTRRRLIRVEEISQGTLDTILVHAREVFRHAITANASAIVLAHNHPSGDPTPSEADVKVTRDLIRAGQLLRIEVLDHVILGRATEGQTRDYASLKELGYFA